MLNKFSNLIIKLTLKVLETVADMLFVILTIAFFILVWSGEVLKAIIIFLIILFIKFMVEYIRLLIKGIRERNDGEG